jgi:hypothetical protein
MVKKRNFWGSIPKGLIFVKLTFSILIDYLASKCWPCPPPPTTAFIYIFLIWSHCATGFIYFQSFSTVMQVRQKEEEQQQPFQSQHSHYTCQYTQFFLVFFATSAIKNFITQRLYAVFHPHLILRPGQGKSKERSLWTGGVLSFLLCKSLLSSLFQKKLQICDDSAMMDFTQVVLSYH